MKFMRLKVGFISGWVLLAVSLVLTGPTIAGAQAPPTDIPDMKLKYATFIAPSGALADMLKWYFNEITKRTGGKVKFDLYWQESLLKMADCLPGVGAGTADLTSTFSSPTIERNPLWATMDLPANGDDNWALIWASYEMMTKDPGIKAEFNKLNVVPLQGYSSGLFFFETKKPVTTLKDLKGLRMRTSGGAFASYMKYAGILPVFVSLSEIYEGLGRGVIDGALSVWQYTWSFKYYEVAPHIVLLKNPGALTASSLLINKDRWEKFPQSLRNIFNELSLEFNDKYAKVLVDEQELLMKKLPAEYGVKLHRLDDASEAELAACAKKAQEEWFSKYEPKGIPVKAVWERSQTLVKKYKAEVVAKGYPWKR